MNEKQNRVAQCKFDVGRQESKVREANIAMEQGYKKLQADMEREYAKLKGEFEREQICLEKEKAYLEYAESELEKGYES